ncbi:MAG TPA: response regulator [Ghiorsea sp.]|nr:response regulator [Ghiorsea sp.]HIP06494.1 response regulator [Mariprofundaceae bacterium]
MKTVLVVEDSNTSRDVTSHFLQQGGFRVLEAEDGQDALNILRSRHVDLILTDIMMPNLDGWGLYKEIRADKSFNLTPFVFLSVLDDIDDQIKGLTLGVDDYLTKPVTPMQLIARVNTALMRSERLEQYFHRNPVTELETEGYFKKRYMQEVDRCRDADLDLSLVVIGIGNYVSLARGQAEWFAEAAATEAGAVIKSEARSYDVVADMGQGCFAVLRPNDDLQKAKTWAEGLVKDWDVSMIWPDTEQRIAVDVGFTCDAISPSDENALAILKKNLSSFERKW